MKKQILLTSFLLCLLVPSISSAQKTVAVTAEKEVAIQNQDVAAARTTALMLAARDAVEKGYGTYVKLEELPDVRQILTKAAAGLQYKILAEQQRGNRYWVKIQASIHIPAEYAGESEYEREGLGESMQNFVQKYPQGEINWGEGFIIAYGRGEITDADDPDAEDKAARAAEVDAKAHLLEMINDIPLDDRMKVGQEQRMSFTLEGFVKGAQVVTKAKSGTRVNVTVKASIRGVKGLTMTVLGYYTPEPPAPPPPPTAQPKPEVAPLAQPESYTGIVIDARGISATPAVFPQIQDTKKQQAYNVGQVNKEDLQKRGMASYAVVARDVPITRLFPKAMVVAVLYTPQSETEQTKPKRRQGYKPLVVSAQEAGGALKANLIVSEEDARRIKALDEKTSALKECRVVVVVSSEVGGLEGRMPAEEVLALLDRTED